MARMGFPNSTWQGKALVIVLACLLCWRGWGQSLPVVSPARADHHAHLFSPAAIQFLAQSQRSRGPEGAPSFHVQTAADLVALLDSAHIQKAVALSFAYIFAAPGNPGEEYNLVTAENDWTAQQVALYPARLVGFCGINPMRDYSVREIQRCKEIGLRGLKLHFSNLNTDIDLGNAQHLKQLKVLFAAANQARFPIIVHLRPQIGREYGAVEARAFIESVLPAAHDVPVQIAHMAGYGGYDRVTDEALGAFVQALRSGQIKRQNLYFDLSGVLVSRAPNEASPGMRRLADQQQKDFPEWQSHLESRIREVGIDRVLFGSSWPDTSPAAYEFLVQEQLKLSPKELRRLLRNVAPYFK